MTKKQLRKKNTARRINRELKKLFEDWGGGIYAASALMTHVRYIISKNL